MQKSSIVGKGPALYREKGDDMEKLLYESVGEHKKVKAVVTVVCAVLVVCGVALMIFSQFKTSSFGAGTATTQYIEGISAVTKYNTGKVYLFSEGVRFALMAAGILSLLLAFFYAKKSAKNEKKKYLKIYENHVEGSIFNGMATKTFQLASQEIENVQLEKRDGVTFITIYTKFEKYPIMMPDDGTKAYNILKAHI